MAKPQYSKPTSQLDAEEKTKKGWLPPGVVKQGEDAGKSDNGYVGVDPIYQNFADVTNQPFASEEGVEKKLEKDLFTDDVDFEKAATPEGQSEAERKADEQEEEDEKKMQGDEKQTQGARSGPSTSTISSSGPPPNPSTPPNPS